METTAKLNGVRLSPQKGRLVAVEYGHVQISEQRSLPIFQPGQGVALMHPGVGQNLRISAFLDGGIADGDGLLEFVFPNQAARQPLGTK